MNKTKQATLFQSWGNKKIVEKRPADHDNLPSVSGEKSGPKDVIDLCDDFDDDDEDDNILLQAEETFAAGLHETTNNFNNQSDINHQEYACDVSFGTDDYTSSQHQAAQDLPGFDPCAGKLWIYPTNYPVRNYQFNIVQQALFKNTMVTLPTGLGKTFIGAVVMYNFYRWYPQGKVVFMAPTKPLVAQQIEACYNIMGIPQQHTAEMTGTMGPQKRKSAWHEKRVFFLTPQVLTNDLSRGSCPGTEVRCLVIDEAHKALGNHAYCQVVRELVKHTESFRVLALSATPGSDIKSVQLVLSNLLISHIEIRTEDSIDIKQYCHERKVDKVVVPLGDELTKVKTKYIQVMDVVVRRLKQFGVLYHRETTSLSKFLILKARESFRQDPPERLQRSQYGIVEGDFAIAMSLYHGYELLQLHGSRSLYNFLQSILSGDKAYGRTRTELAKNADFNDLVELLSEKYKVSDSETEGAKPLIVGHPKMVRLQDIVLEHFNKFNGAATRVMIFSQYRDSVQEITNMLHFHQPMIKVMSFIGQASTSKTTKGFTQKEQLKVMKQFREGGYNTLVSTCVGEEGLDIGDVDLIICFDAHKSPIRLVQRMGRTGRKREGRIVMLLTEGKEEQIYNQSQYSKRSIHKAILNGARSLHFYQHSPRMIPDGFTPAVHKMHITVKETFKTEKKITPDKKGDQKPIAQAMVEAGNKKSTEEVLTLEEYRELEPWLVPEWEIPKLAPSSMMSLPPKQEEAGPPGVLLSLSEWLPWQNMLQETNKVDHSMAARHLVELMGFIQIQQSLDPDDDPYGLEMAAYLNHDDVLNPGETEDSRGPMLKWCQSKMSDTKDTNHSNIKGSKKKKASVSKSGRCRDAFQALEELENNCDKSSDDDLPAFDLGNKPHDKPVSHEKEHTDNSTGKQLKRKRRHTSNQSVIHVLQDTDSMDFDHFGTNFESCSTKKSKTTVFASTSTLNEAKQAFNITKCEISAKSPKAKKKLHEELYSIPTPPSTENLTEIFCKLDNIETLNVDLAELVKEWQTENPLGKFAVSFKKDADFQSDSSVEDFPVLCTDTNKFKSDNDGKRGIISPCSIEFDGDVRSDVDMKESDMSLVMKNENDSKHDQSSTKYYSSDSIPPFKLYEDKMIEVQNSTCVSLRSPKADEASDHSSSSLEESPVFHKSQRKNMSDQASSRSVKTSNSFTSSSKADKSVRMSDSWSCDGMDDSLFKAIKTQHVSGAQNAGTQVTFTQAFDCLHSNSLGSDVDSHESEKKSFVRDMDKHRDYEEIRKTNTKKTSCEMENNGHTAMFSSSFEYKTQKASIDIICKSEESDEVMEGENERHTSSNQTSIRTHHEEEGILNDSQSSSHNETGASYRRSSSVIQNQSNVSGKEVSKQSSSEEEDVEFPDFNLGFDIDDGIIPPSPQSQQSKVTRLSQIFSSDVSDRMGEKRDGKQCMKTILETDESLNEKEIATGDISMRRKKLFKNINVELSNSTSKNDSSKQRTSDKYETRTDNKYKEITPTEVVDSTSGDSKTVSDKKEIRHDNEDSQADSTGYQYNSLNFDTSFALLDDDLDEWIDSGRNIPYVATETKIQSEQEIETEVNEENVDKCDDASEVSKSIEKLHNLNTDKTASTCDKDSSIYMKDMSSMFFEDSFNSPSNTTPSVKADKSKTSAWLTSKSSTSTPLVNPQRKVNTVTPFRSFCETADAHNETDFDDSFIVRRKKKANKIDSSESESNDFSDKCKQKDKIKERTSSKKNQTLNKIKKSRLVELVTSSSEDEDFDDSFLLTKNKYIVRKPEEPQFTRISSDEFEEDISSGDQKASTSRNRNIGATSKTRKSVKHKRPSNPFIEEEAELSEENDDGASSDEEEGSDLDKYDDSFIHDSQFSQAAAMNQTDMQAVYMKSVISPVAKRGGYKLAYHSKHVDVFSQVPQEEESQYMEDSFCVGSEEDSEDEMDWLAMGKEESCGEITMLNTNASMLQPRRPRRKNAKSFLTSRQRDMHAGRMRALDEIKAKALNKKTEKVGKGISNNIETKSIVSKKNRIQVLEESSEEDEENAIQLSKFASPAAKLIERTKKKRLRIMSSSDDELDSCENLETKRSSVNSSREENSYEDDFMTKIKPRMKSHENRDIGMSCDSELNAKSKSGFLISACKSSAKPATETVILVDSKELNGAQSIISDLRFKHNIHVSTAQLSSCDYLVSNRTAVERKQWSEFSNGGNRAKLIERVQQLERLYDKVCLIVEKDRVKPGEESSKVTNWSKYIDKTCAMLLRSPVKILFSENQSETAVILSDLCQVEHRKQMGITGRVELNSDRSNLVKFYTSLPNITYINALNLCDGFSSVGEFMSSSVQLIEERGKMSKARAAAVHNFIRRNWDPTSVAKNKS